MFCQTFPTRLSTNLCSLHECGISLQIKLNENQMALNMIMISLFFISAHLYLFVFLFGHAGGREVKIGEFHSTNEVLDLGIGARIAWKGKHKVK